MQPKFRNQQLTLLQFAQITPVNQRPRGAGTGTYWLDSPLTNRRGWEQQLAKGIVRPNRGGQRFVDGFAGRNTKLGGRPMMRASQVGRIRNYSGSVNVYAAPEELYAHRKTQLQMESEAAVDLHSGFDAQVEKEVVAKKVARYGGPPAQTK